MRKLVSTMLVAAVLFATVPGCATILSGTQQAVMVNSDPAGAKVKVGPHTGTTPAIFDLEKDKAYPIEVTYKDHREVIYPSRTFDPVSLLNLIPPLWPGFIVDAVTGAITHYEPDTYNITFIPREEADE